MTQSRKQEENGTPFLPDWHSEHIYRILGVISSFPGLWFRLAQENVGRHRSDDRYRQRTEHVLVGSRKMLGQCCSLRSTQASHIRLATTNPHCNRYITSALFPGSVTPTG